MITTKKKFELMDHPLAKIPDIRKQVQAWAKRQGYTVVRIHYGLEEQHQMIDVVTVEYSR